MSQVVSFKSVPEFFFKELSGRKPFTMRRIESGDSREELIGQFSAGLIEVLYVRIVNSESGEFFDRLISDISYYEGWTLISWVSWYG